MKSFKSITQLKKCLVALVLGLISFNSIAQVKVGADPTNINASSLLELQTQGNRAGFKIAEVALTGVLDNTTTPVTADSRGTLVYNTATAGTAPNNVTPGFYVWMGTQWEKVLSSTNGNDKNVYEGNGTLTGNRTVALATNTIAFTSTATTGTSHFTVDGTTLNIDAVNNRVGIGTAIPEGALDITSTTGAFMPPRMTTAQRDALANKPAGAIIFNTDLAQLQLNAGTSASPLWSALAQSSTTLNTVHVRSSTSVINNLTTNGVVTLPSQLFDNSGGFVTYNSGTGNFTLKAGKTYQLEFSANWVRATNNCGWFRLRWYNATTSTFFGVPQHFEFGSNPLGSGVAFAYLSPQVDTNVNVQISNTNNGCTFQIGDSGGGGCFPSVKITVLN